MAAHGPVDKTPQPPAYEELLELLRWAGDHIVIRNANGKRSDRFCLICRFTRLREPCRHGAMWALGGRGPGRLDGAIRK